MVRRSPSCRGWPRLVASVGSVLKPTPGLCSVARAYREVGRERARTVRRELPPMIAPRTDRTVRMWSPIVLANPPPWKATGVGPRRPVDGVGLQSKGPTLRPRSCPLTIAARAASNVRWSAGRSTTRGSDARCATVLLITWAPVAPPATDCRCRAGGPRLTGSPGRLADGIPAHPRLIGPEWCTSGNRMPVCPGIGRSWPSSRVVDRPAWPVCCDARNSSCSSVTRKRAIARLPAAGPERLCEATCASPELLARGGCRRRARLR